MSYSTKASVRDNYEGLSAYYTSLCIKESDPQLKHAYRKIGNVIRSAWAENDILSKSVQEKAKSDLASLYWAHYVVLWQDEFKLALELIGGKI